MQVVDKLPPVFRSRIFRILCVLSLTSGLPCSLTCGSPSLPPCIVHSKRESLLLLRLTRCLRAVCVRRRYRPVVEQPYIFRVRHASFASGWSRLVCFCVCTNKIDVRALPLRFSCPFSILSQDVSDALIDTVACELTVDIFMPQVQLAIYWAHTTPLRLRIPSARTQRLCGLRPGSETRRCRLHSCHCR